MTRIFLFLGCPCLFLAAAASSSADDVDQGKDKKSPGIIQIDLSKLPPDLAKQLMRYSEGKGKEKAKKTETKSGPPQLPPGLARKPADHPGRVAWLKAHSDTKEPVPAPAKTKDKEKKKGEEKKKSEGLSSASSLEQRIDQLMREIEELRREIRRKK